MTSLTYYRANGLFHVSSDQGEKRVTEQALLAIGDQDITETVERAKDKPYTPQVLTFKRRVCGRIA